jgi:hypothetical protein
MTTACTITNREDLARHYARGALDARAHEEFETHLVGCEQCQREVRMASAVQVALGDKPLALSRQESWLPVAVSGLASAAAVIVAVVVLRSPRDVAPLGEINVPPAYLGVAVRGGEAQDFESAMRLYDAGRWLESHRALSTTAATTAAPDAAWFFAGASALMLGQNQSAIDAFDRVIALGTGPYTNEAHFYRAKSLLRTGRVVDALADLRLIEPSSVVGAHARALTDSVLALGVR